MAEEHREDMIFPRTPPVTADAEMWMHGTRYRPVVNGLPEPGTTWRPGQRQAGRAREADAVLARVRERLAAKYGLTVREMRELVMVHEAAERMRGCAVGSGQAPTQHAARGGTACRGC